MVNALRRKRSISAGAWLEAGQGQRKGDTVKEEMRKKEYEKEEEPEEE